MSIFPESYPSALLSTLARHQRDSIGLLSVRMQDLIDFAQDPYMQVGIDDVENIGVEQRGWVIGSGIEFEDKNRHFLSIVLTPDKTLWTGCMVINHGKPKETKLEPVTACALDALQDEALADLSVPVIRTKKFGNEVLAHVLHAPEAIEAQINRLIPKDRSLYGMPGRA